MGRRCSHCSNDGHNSRTCGVRLFGVRLIIKKSASMGNLSNAVVSPAPEPDGYLSDDPRRNTDHRTPHRKKDGSIIKRSASMGNVSLLSTAVVSPNPDSHGPDPDGYLSNDPGHNTDRRSERKKGVPWTEEEHRLFLLGLQKLGKGDWRGISRNYVTSRTPTQVASHAQKYFIRQGNGSRRKRRSSLFDMVPEMQDEPTIPEDNFMLPPSRTVERDDPTTFPSLRLSLNSEYKPMQATSSEKQEETNETTPFQLNKTTPIQSVETSTMIPTFFPAFLPVPFSLWPQNAAPIEENRLIDTSYHEVFRPIPVVRKESVKLDELVGMSQLSIKENENRHMEPSPLYLNLIVGGSSRPSAFHASSSSNEFDLDNDKR